jgi:uncharacterized protein
MRLLFIFLTTVIFLYLFYVGYFWLAQRSILFPTHMLPVPPAPAEGYAGMEQLWLETQQGAVEAWYLPPHTWDAGQPAPLIIMGHGNGELIDFWIEPVTELRRMGIGVLLVEYPGYGRSAGNPSQTGITETFLAGYDAMLEHPDVDPARIVLFGRSVGAAAVAILSTLRPSAALILFSTFTSIRDLATERYLLPIGVRDPFDTINAVRNYSEPVLVIHGTQDRLIPYAHGVRLYEAAADGELVSLPCGHNNCVSRWDAFWQSLRPFLIQAGVLP